jgi:hypothetical protein
VLNLHEVVEFLAKWHSALALVLGGVSRLSWGMDKNVKVMAKKSAILKQLRFLLSIEMVKQLPLIEGHALDLKLLSVVEFKEEFKENAQNFLASQDKRFMDYIKCYNHYSTYNIAYNLHRWTWIPVAVIGILLGQHYINTKPCVALLVTVVSCLGVVIPWLVMVWQSDRLDGIVGEYDASV